MNRGLARAFVFLGAVALSQQAWADKIGVASAVRNDVTVSLAGPPQPLAAGSNVFANQRIRTGVASTAQLLFLDETSVSVAPSSEIVLDKFVFNPNRGAGNVVLTTGRGAFRFVTGAQNPTNYTIKTPVATIGVRGTIVEIRNAMMNGVMVSVITLIEGSVQIRNNAGQTAALTQPGKSIVVGGDGRMQGPLTAHGSTYAYFGDPQRFDMPDNRMDLNDVLRPREAITPHDQHDTYRDSGYGNNGGNNFNCPTCR